MADDFYHILGVSKTTSKDEIKKAYRKLARKWHPDINPGNKEAEQKFKDISRSYDCLGNDEKRKLYDEFGEEGLQSGFDAEKTREYKQWSNFQQAAQGQQAQGLADIKAMKMSLETFLILAAEEEVSEQEPRRLGAGTWSMS